jgi:hypothetical protein
MHTKEIRTNCRPCGYHRVGPIQGSAFPADICGLSGEECSKIKSCSPDVRIPLRKKPNASRQTGIEIPDFRESVKRSKRLS